MVVQNDHYIDQVFLEPGTHEITSDTDFAMVAMRIRANQSDPGDDEAIAALRARVKLEVGGNASRAANTIWSSSLRCAMSSPLRAPSSAR